MSLDAKQRSEMKCLKLNPSNPIDLKLYEFRQTGDRVFARERLRMLASTSVAREPQNTDTTQQMEEIRQTSLEIQEFQDKHAQELTDRQRSALLAMRVAADGFADFLAGMAQVALGFSSNLQRLSESLALDRRNDIANCLMATIHLHVMYAKQHAGDQLIAQLLQWFVDGQNHLGSCSKAKRCAKRAIRQSGSFCARGHLLLAELHRVEGDVSTAKDLLDALEEAKGDRDGPCLQAADRAEMEEIRSCLRSSSSSC